VNVPFALADATTLTQVGGVGVRLHPWAPGVSGHESLLVACACFYLACSNNALNNAHCDIPLHDTVQAGYVGDDVESILHKLLASCNFQVEIAQQVRT
jgi:hypothetical protein